LKLLDIVQKIWAPLRKLFAPPGVPSWLRACLTLGRLFSYSTVHLSTDNFSFLPTEKVLWHLLFFCFFNSSPNETKYDKHRSAILCCS